ncbi:MAG: type II toxin-antitoxin system HicA family toxin [Firmicutes bacterium]|nr:type II toxin-antitoxin system HicA family toxin [Bacillota bacterium]
MLEAQGFTLVRQKGSHIRLRKEEIGRTLLVTVPSNQKQIRKGTLNGILSQAGLSKEELVALFQV